ncbi:unnamed protein product [Prunus armeniaca]
MLDCKPTSTPLAAKTTLTTVEGDLLSSPTAYREVMGCFQYLTITRPDLAFASHSTCISAYSDADWAGCPNSRRSTPCCTDTPKCWSVGVSDTPTLRYGSDTLSTRLQHGQRLGHGQDTAPTLSRHGRDQI